MRDGIERFCIVIECVIEGEVSIGQHVWLCKSIYILIAIWDLFELMGIGFYLLDVP